LSSIVDPRGRASAAAERRLPPLLRRAWFSLNQAFRRRLAHLELTPDQFTVLRTLSEAGRDGLNQRALTGLMSSDPNTITSLLERMEEAGLVRREADLTDRRVRRVLVTPVGKRRFVVARGLALGLQAEVLALLPPGAREGFLARLETVADAARAAAERSPRTPARGG